MKVNRLNKVQEDCKRLLKLLTQTKNLTNCDVVYGVEAAAVRRASMDLTRSLADLRKSDYEKLTWEE